MRTPVVSGWAVTRIPSAIAATGLRKSFGDHLSGVAVGVCRVPVAIELLADHAALASGAGAGVVLAACAGPVGSRAASSSGKMASARTPPISESVA